jgi:hypothetical protein
MATFSVILEDVTKEEVVDKKKPAFTISNRRVAQIEADDLPDAWLKARTKYYVEQADGPDTQIVDIKAGIIELEQTPEKEEG